MPLVIILLAIFLLALGIAQFFDYLIKRGQK